MAESYKLLTLHVPAELYAALARQAEETGVSINGLAITILAARLETMTRRQRPEGST